MPGSDPIPLYLFAKAPQPGKVKTRMQPALGGESCAALATRMLEQSAARVGESWPGPKILCVAPDRQHPLFQRLAAKFGFSLLEQADCDLGGRMLAALQHGLAGCDRAVVMGCDVPYIGGEILARAWQEMQSANNVMGPAEDGGFYLLGVDRLPIAAFEGVAWGSSKVGQQVIRQGRQQGLEFRMLPTLRDIDVIGDLVWLARSQPGYGDLLPEMEPERERSPGNGGAACNG